MLRKARETSEDEEKRRLTERQKRDTEEKAETERRHKEELVFFTYRNFEIGDFRKKFGSRKSSRKRRHA